MHAEQVRWRRVGVPQAAALVLACALVALLLLLPWAGPLLMPELAGALPRLRDGALAGLLIVLLASLYVSHRRGRAAEAAEARLRGVLDATPGSIIVIDGQDRIISANPQTAGLFGYRPEELVGQELQRLLPYWHADPKAVPGLLSEPPSTADLRESLGRRKDGSEMPLEIGASRCPTPREEGLSVLAMRDVSKAKQTKAILREREAHLRLVVEQMPAILWTTDARLQITSTMGAGLAALGMQPSEVIGMTMLENLGTDSLEATPIAAHLSALRGESLSYEMEWKNRTFQVRVEPLRNSEKKITGTIGIVLDITDRKQTMAELQARAQQQAAVAELGQRALAGLDVDALLGEAARLVTEALDVESARVLGCEPRGGLMPRAAAGPLAARPVPEADAQAAYTLKVRTPVLVEDLRMEERFAVPLPAEHGGPACGMSVIIPGAHQPFGVLDAHSDRERKFTRDDLNFLQAVANILATTIGRKQAEEARARLVAILEATTDFVAIAGVDHRVLYLNRAGRALTGLSATEDAARHTLLDFYPADGCKALRNEALPAALRKGAWSGETVLKGTGGEVAVSQVVLAHRSPTGAVEFFSVIARDISEQQRLEEQFRQAQKMEAVGRLAGGIAHDFNNLLTIITGYSDFLVDCFPEGDDRQGFALEVKKAAERAATLTRQLLAFSRKQMLMPRVLNLNSLVANMDKMLCRLMGEDIELVTALEPTLHPVKADPGQLEQIVMNLAVNARDAMERGGKLTIRTGNVTLGPAYVREHPEVRQGPYVLLAVGDTGCGMDLATRERIFEPFFTTKEVGKGTGLGLATVYGIVKQSGGHIEVESEVGAGSTFKIYLPRMGEALPLSEPVAKRAEPAGGTETVLLVEDEPGVRQLGRDGLRARGYTVLEAGTGEEALALAERHAGRIDLLLTDVVMPRLSGARLAERLAPQRPEMKVLFVSGYTDTALLRHGVQHGEVDCLLKPFTPEDLARKVREVLDRGGLDRVPAAPLFDTRSEPRHAPAAEVGVECRQTKDGLGPNVAQGLLNLSPSGACVLVSAALEPGQQVEVTLSSQGRAGPLRVSAEVTWTQPEDEGRHRAGLRFLRRLNGPELQPFVDRLCRSA
jgi:PAS domain S-box-containing protein